MVPCVRVCVCVYVCVCVCSVLLSRSIRCDVSMMTSFITRVLARGFGRCRPALINVAGNLQAQMLKLLPNGCRIMHNDDDDALYIMTPVSASVQHRGHRSSFSMSRSVCVLLLSLL